MKFGWKQSSGNLNVPEFKTSENLVKLAAATGTSDEYFIPEHTPVSNQGNLGTCAANAGCDMWEILYGLENPNSVTQLSRLFLYWNARMYTQDTDKDEGTYIHNAMHSLTTLGVCTEKRWPYIENKVFTQPNQLSYKEGDDNTFSTFYQITSFDDQRVKDIELAVRANHPVIFGTQVGQEWMDYRGADKNKVFNFPTASKGGHAMLIVGVRTNTAGKKEFYIRNSWGAGWGIAGHGWFSQDYITNDGTNDLFVGTRMAGLLL